MNVPVPAGAGDPLYRSLVAHVVAPLVRAFEPQLVLISAGYDAHVEDPLAECHVTEVGYASMTRIMRHVCTDVQAPLGCVLEGGYALSALARSVSATLEALGSPVRPPSDADARVEIAPIASAALQRLDPWWPGLGSA